MTSKGYRLVFDIAGGVKVTSELAIEDVDEMRWSGRYRNLPHDDAEARRLVVRTRLAYLTDMSDGHLVLADPAGGEWIIPGRSVLSATFMEPGDESEHRLGFGQPGDRDMDVPWAGFTVLPGGKV
jgi:hypothetical protein